MYKTSAVLAFLALVLLSAVGMAMLASRPEDTSHHKFFDLCAQLFAGALVALILLVCDASG